MGIVSWPDSRCTLENGTLIIYQHEQRQLAGAQSHDNEEAERLQSSDDRPSCRREEEEEDQQRVEVPPLPTIEDRDESQNIVVDDKHDMPVVELAYLYCGEGNDPPSLQEALETFMPIVRS